MFALMIAIILTGALIPVLKSCPYYGGNNNICAHDATQVLIQYILLQLYICLTPAQDTLADTIGMVMDAKIRARNQ